MADQPQQAAKPSRFGFLARKLGPLPVWIWAVIVVALYFLYRWYTTGSFTSSGAAGGTTQPAGGPVTIRQTVTDTLRRVAKKPAKRTKKPAPKRKKRDGNAPVAAPLTAVPSDGAVRGNPDTKNPARRKPVATPGPVQARAPGTKTSTTTTTAVGTPQGGVEQVAGGGPGVVYEGPVYGLWTTEQQGVQAFDSSQGQESVNVTAA